MNKLIKPINWLGKIERLEENQRRLEREIIKCRRREEQFIFLFKKALDMHKSSNYTTRHREKVITMRKFLEMMEKIVMNDDLIKQRETNDVDLISELIKKGEVYDETINQQDTDKETSML